MRNYLVAVLAAATVFTAGIMLAASGPRHAAVVHNGTSATITDVRFNATDYEGDPFGSGQASSLKPGEELHVRVRGDHLHIRLDFTLDDTAHVEFVGPVSYGSADVVTITVTPDGTISLR